jgi:hypothetical protein
MRNGARKGQRPLEFNRSTGQALLCRRCCVYLSSQRKSLAYRRIDFHCDNICSIWPDCSPRYRGTRPKLCTTRRGARQRARWQRQRTRWQLRTKMSETTATSSPSAIQFDKLGRQSRETLRRGSTSTLELELLQGLS